MHIQAYLFLGGRCEEAIAFYRRAFGAEVTALMRFRDSPEPPPAEQVPADWGDRVMHASLRIGDSEMMMSDGCATDAQGMNGFALSIAADSDSEAERLFRVLGKDGQVIMPMNPTFFATRFGMVNDRFGVPWMVIGPSLEGQ